MYSASQVQTFTIAHLTGGGGYLDCHVTFTHPLEVDLGKSLDGIGVIDLEVPEFAAMSDQKRRRAIARRITDDKKKEATVEDIIANREKKEADRLAKLAEKEKEAELEGKGKSNGKKKVDGGGEVPATSTVDQGSAMQAGSGRRLKRKAVLSEVTTDLVTQGTDVIVIGDDAEVNSEELILNMSIVDVMDDMGTPQQACYTEVVEFTKKVIHSLFEL